MMRQPHAEAAQTAQAEIDVLRPDTEAEILMRLDDRSKGLLRRGDRTEHDVGMTTDIFRRGLDPEGGTVGERLEIERRRPGVVENDQRALSMGSLGDGRKVLHLESLGAWGFGEHHPRLIGDQPADAFPNQRIVIDRRDTEPLQQFVAETTGGAIDAVNYKYLIARL